MWIRENIILWLRNEMDSIEHYGTSAQLEWLDLLKDCMDEWIEELEKKSSKLAK